METINMILNTEGVALINMRRGTTSSGRAKKVLAII